MAEVGRALCKSADTKPILKPPHAVATGTAQVQGVAPPQVQNFAFHEVPLSPFLKPFKIPLDGSTTLWIYIHNTFLGHLFNALPIL